MGGIGGLGKEIPACWCVCREELLARLTTRAGWREVGARYGVLVRVASPSGCTANSVWKLTAQSIAVRLNMALHDEPHCYPQRRAGLAAIGWQDQNVVILSTIMPALVSSGCPVSSSRT